MKKLRLLKIDTVLIIISVISFVGVFFTGFIYQANNNEPIWLHYITEALGGICYCSWGVFSMLTSKHLWSQTNYWFVKKIVAVPIFLLSILLLPAGLFLLWRAMGNLFKYMVF